MIKKSLNNIIKNFKAVICLDGELPQKDFFSSLNLPIIAVDGAANSLHSIDIKPTLIIGDLDSYNKNFFQNVKKICTPDQNYSDFEKALKYLFQENLLPAIITGVTGGYLDHILHNLAVFSQSKCIIYGDDQIGIMTDENIKLNLNTNTKVSIIGFPKAMVSSSGLKWE